MERARVAIGCEAMQRWRKIASECRATTLIINEGQWCVTLGQSKDQLDHIVAVLTAHPRGAGHRRTVACEDLTCKFRDAVDRLGVRRVVLGVRPIERPIKNVVGAHVYQMRIDGIRCVAQCTDGLGVHRASKRMIRLTRVDGGVSRSVDDRVGAMAFDERTNRRRVGDIKSGSVSNDHVVTDIGRVADKVGSELACGSRHHQLHGCKATLRQAQREADQDLGSSQ